MKSRTHLLEVAVEEEDRASLGLHGLPLLLTQEGNVWVPVGDHGITGKDGIFPQEVSSYT